MGSLALAKWARPEAVTDFDPYAQWDRRTNVIDLDIPGRIQTNKRRSRIVCCRTLAASMVTWMEPRTFTDHRLGVQTVARPAPLLYKREPVGTVKRAVKRIADDIGLPDITQKSPRTFMATMVRKLAPAVPREKRSMWLGHTVQEGSRTTDHYEISDPEYLADVALATDYVLQQLLARCVDKSFAIEVRLNREDLRRIGAVLASPVGHLRLKCLRDPSTGCWGERRPPSPSRQKGEPEARLCVTSIP